MTTHDEYAAIPGVNWSSLKHMDASPLEYQWALSHPRADTVALRLGRAIHCAVLEPEAFGARYIVRPADLDGRTKAGKAALADLEASGLEVIDAEHVAITSACEIAVRAHPVASLVFEGATTEQTITWTDAATGVRCKGRVDALHNAGERGWLADLKSTGDLTRFPVDAFKRLYHGQLAYYADGARAAGLLGDDCDVYVVAVSTAQPVDVVVYDVSQELLDAGRKLYRRLLKRLVECEASGEWPGRCSAMETLTLPRWAAGADEPTDIEW